MEGIGGKPPLTPPVVENKRAFPLPTRQQMLARTQFLVRNRRRPGEPFNIRLEAAVIKRK